MSDIWTWIAFSPNTCANLCFTAGTQDLPFTILIGLFHSFLGLTSPFWLKAVISNNGKIAKKKIYINIYKFSFCMSKTKRGRLKIEELHYIHLIRSYRICWLHARNTEKSGRDKNVQIYLPISRDLVTLMECKFTFTCILPFCFHWSICISIMWI